MGMDGLLLKLAFVGVYEGGPYKGMAAWHGRESQGVHEICETHADE